MSRGTADNRATADDALMRYADILDGRKRLIEDRGRSTRHGASRFYFYKSRNGLLPPEIESPFAEACDEIRRCGNVALANIVTLLHEDLAAKFSATALLYQEAAQLEREGDRISKRQEEAYRRKEEKRVEFLNDLLRDCPENIWDLPTDQISEAWRKVEEAKREAEARAHDMFHEELDFDPYLDLEICLDERFSPSLKSLEECFERNATAIRSITKTGLKDRRDEKLDQIIAAICLGNQTQAETKKAVVGVRDDVRELKPEIVRGANAAESADANAAAAKTAAEGAKESAEGAEQVAKESKSLVEIVVAGVEKAVNLIRACLAPRSVDCEVTIEQLSAMLAAKGLESGTGVRLIQLWEQYLKSGGAKGTQPPDGYTLATRQTLASATAWVEYHVAHKKSRLKTGETFNEVSARHNASRIADNAPKPRRGE